MLRALTRGGARALRRGHDLGQLAVGCAADIALLDLDTVAFTPLNDLRRQLIHCEDGSSVRTTIVAGRVVYENGRIASVDERALRAELRALMVDYRAHLARAGAGGATPRTLLPCDVPARGRRGHRHEPLARVVFAPDQFGF